MVGGGLSKHPHGVVGEGSKSARKRTAGVLCSIAAAAAGLAGCGGDDDFENKPRPAVPVQLTGVITENEVTISPDSLGAGPVVLIVSNQTQQAHTITLEGEDVREKTPLVNPLDTATIQKTLKPGSYTVKAGSERATPREIVAATLSVGPPRPSSSDELLLP
jgi:hypothetical protein